MLLLSPAPPGYRACLAGCRAELITEFHLKVFVLLLVVVAEVVVVFLQKELRDKYKFPGKVRIHSVMALIENEFRALLLFNFVCLFWSVLSSVDPFCLWEQYWFKLFEQCPFQRLYLSA